MKKFLVKFKEDLKRNWAFYVAEVVIFAFLEFFVFKLEPVKAVIIIFGIVLISLVGVIITGVRDIFKNRNIKSVIL